MQDSNSKVVSLKDCSSFEVPANAGGDVALQASRKQAATSNDTVSVFCISALLNGKARYAAEYYTLHVTSMFCCHDFLDDR